MGMKHWRTQNHVSSNHGVARTKQKTVNTRSLVQGGQKFTTERHHPTQDNSPLGASNICGHSDRRRLLVNFSVNPKTLVHDDIEDTAVR